MEALATKYRPKTWEDCTEQSSILRILKKQVETDSIKNCYLFCGSSGCGKTTTARILADRINKGVGSPIEIDGASNNGVDNIRNITKSSQERSIDGKYKTYIIDECHSLTNQSWQAFLKCLEEPPAFTVFIFCTTDPQKIPATVLNRVQRFNFTKISALGIAKRLAYICQQEGYTNYSDSVEYISKIADGGMRDAISMLDKCACYSTDLSMSNVLDALGNYSYSMFFNLINSMIDGSECDVLEVITSYHNAGNDLRIFVDQFLDFSLDLAKYALFNSTGLLKIPSTLENDIKNATSIDNPVKYYTYVTNKLLELKNSIKYDTNIRSTVEITFLNITRCV